MNDNQLNKILLKPRFKIERTENKAVIIEKFKNKFTHGSNKFSGKIVDHHIIIDVRREATHFWSPQLHVEVEENQQKTTVIKGLFGPKPNVWSLFMFAHFGVGLAFLIFLVLCYTRWSLNQDYTFAILMCITMPIAWFVLYLLGRIGRKKGRAQMNELHEFFFQILEN